MLPKELLRKHNDGPPDCGRCFLPWEKTTDDLVELAYAINPFPTPKREMDRLLSTGEQISISLLSMTLQTMGYKAISLYRPPGWDTNHWHAYKSRALKGIDTTKILEALNDDMIVIVAGFQGRK